MKRYDPQCYNWDSSTSEGAMVELEDGDYVLYDEAQAEIDASKKLCEIYFTIASELIGEDEVRQRRDKKLNKGKFNFTSAY